MVYTRSFRKWWKKLPDHKKEQFKEYLFQRMHVIALILSSFIGGWLFLYYIHLEDTPYTKRSRYVGVTPNQIRDIAETLWRKLLEEHADDIVSVSHPDHKRAFSVLEKLINANSDENMKNINWELNVISSNDIINAFVLPVSMSTLMWYVLFEMLSTKVEIFLTFKFVKFTKYGKTGIEYDVCSWIINAEFHWCTANTDSKV